LIVSCKKDNSASSQPTKTSEEILTSKTWRLDEIRFLQGNVVTYYKRGVTSDPYSFNTESIKFNTDKSGTYIAGGITYTMTWDFVDTKKTSLKLIINYTTPLTVNWENLAFSDSSISYAEYYNRTGNNVFSIATRIP
jgi:hypothetical protein